MTPTPFSPNYKGRNSFSRIARENASSTKSINIDIIERVYRENHSLFSELKVLYNSYIKKENAEMRIKVYGFCNSRLEEMVKNTKKANISLDELYADRRQEIVADVNLAKEILVSLQ